MSVAIKLERKEKRLGGRGWVKNFPYIIRLTLLFIGKTQQQQPSLIPPSGVGFYRENNFKEIKMYHKVTKEKLKEEN